MSNIKVAFFIFIINEDLKKKKFQIFLEFLSKLFILLFKYSKKFQK